MAFPPGQDSPNVHGDYPLANLILFFGFLIASIFALIQAVPSILQLLAGRKEDRAAASVVTSVAPGETPTVRLSAQSMVAQAGSVTTKPRTADVELGILSQTTGPTSVDASEPTAGPAPKKTAPTLQQAQLATPNPSRSHQGSKSRSRNRQSRGTHGSMGGASASRQSKVMALYAQPLVVVASVAGTIRMLDPQASEEIFPYVASQALQFVEVWAIYTIWLLLLFRNILVIHVASRTRPPLWYRTFFFVLTVAVLVVSLVSLVLVSIVNNIWPIIMLHAFLSFFSFAFIIPPLLVNRRVLAPILRAAQWASSSASKRKVIHRLQNFNRVAMLGAFVALLIELDFIGRDLAKLDERFDEPKFTKAPIVHVFNGSFELFFIFAVLWHSWVPIRTCCPRYTCICECRVATTAGGTTNGHGVGGAHSKGGKKPKRDRAGGQSPPSRAAQLTADDMRDWSHSQQSSYDRAKVHSSHWSSVIEERRKNARPAPNGEPAAVAGDAGPDASSTPRFSSAGPLPALVKSSSRILDAADVGGLANETSVHRGPKRASDPAAAAHS